MFDPYYSIESFCRLKMLEKCIEKFNFCITYNGTQKNDGFVGFESNDLHHSEVTKLCSLRTIPVTVDDVSFCDGHRICIHK